MGASVVAGIRSEERAVMRCVLCGGVRANDGVCGGCQLRGVRRLGPYIDFGKYWEGGMSDVHVAWHPETDRLYALKFLKSRFLDDAAGLAILRDEIKTLARLEHPNITRVYPNVFEAEEPFFAMQYLEGGSLADPENAERFRDPARALELVLKIVRAVRFAHRSGVLHCDLKPDNILFDESGEPYVSDFGLARRTGPGASGGPIGGASGWMAPEQVLRRDPSTASDVFSLGIILHWLLHGQLPFGSGTEYERRVLEDERPAPGPWERGLAWPLRAICFKALQVEPNDRYPGGAQLERDLVRAKRGRPVLACPTPWWGRLWLWIARHRLATVTTLVIVAVVLAATVTAARGADEQEHELRRTVLAVNADAARGQAAAVLYTLRRQAESLLRASVDPAMRAIAESRSPEIRSSEEPLPRGRVEDTCRHQLALADPAPLVPHAQDFDILHVLDTEGCPRARSLPPPDGYAHRYLGWRDYYRGAARYGTSGIHDVYIAQVFRSSVSQEVRFSLSAPIFDAGRWVGVVTGGRTVHSMLPLRRTHLESEGRVLALVGPHEGEHPLPDGPRELTFLAHPKLGLGEERLMDSVMTEELRQTFGARLLTPEQWEPSTKRPITKDDYVDPFLGGRWLAAFAPVGNTGYVVLVQTNEDVAIRPSEVFLRRLALGFGLAVLVGLVSVGGFAALRFRTSRGRGASDRGASSSLWPGARSED
jgi:serine/threonine-protein kinase